MSDRTGGGFAPFPAEEALGKVERSTMKKQEEQKTFESRHKNRVKRSFLNYCKLLQSLRASSENELSWLLYMPA